MKVQVVLVGTLEIDLQDYKEGYLEQEGFDSEEEADIDEGALTTFALEQLKEQLADGDQELEEADFLSVTLVA